MSTKVIASIATLLVTFLPMFGIELGAEAITTTVQSVVVIGSAIWVWYRTVSKEDVSPLGMRK